MEPKYYADGEDAYAMKRDLVLWSKQQGITPADPDTFYNVTKQEPEKKKWMNEWRKNLQEHVLSSFFSLSDFALCLILHYTISY